MHNEPIRSYWVPNCGRTLLKHTTAVRFKFKSQTALDSTPKYNFCWRSLLKRTVHKNKMTDSSLSPKHNIRSNNLYFDNCNTSFPVYYLAYWCWLLSMVHVWFCSVCVSPLLIFLIFELCLTFFCENLKRIFTLFSYYILVQILCNTD